MKSLNSIQRLCKIGKVLSKIAFILSVIGFGGGVGAGVKVTPVCFLVVKDGNVRILTIAEPANTTADRIVEMVPETLDRISALFEKKKE